MSAERMRPAWSTVSRLVLWTACMTMTACVSHQAIESKHERIAAELEPGDRVEIALANGEEISFRVTEIRETALVGDTSTNITTGKIVSVRYEDITRLERVDQRPLVVVGSIVAVPTAALIVLFALFVAGGGVICC